MARILVVDDRRVNREFLVTLLGYAGHVVLEAESGEAGLRASRIDTPDLVISDILMPTMDGYEFASQLRRDPATAGIPVIFYTAHYFEHEARSLAVGCGVRHIISKPSSPELVLQTVQEALSSPGGDTGGVWAGFDREHVKVLADRLSRSADELRWSNERFSILLDLARRFVSPEDTQSVLDRVCADARVIVGARHCVIALLDEGDPSRFSGVAGDTISVPVRQTILEGGLPGDAFQSVLKTCRPVSLAGPAADPATLGLPPQHPPIHGLLAVAIATSRVFGIMYLVDSVDHAEFDPQDQDLARCLAAQVAIWCENMSLVSTVKKHAAELERRIQERNALELQLRESQKLDALGRLAGGIAHDLNNLMTVILGYSSAAEEDLGPSHSASEGIGEIRNAAERATRMVRQLLAFGRRQVLRLQAVKIGQILADMEPMVRPLIGEHLRVVVERPMCVASVQADPGQIEQVIMNLILNARDAMPNGGTLAIRVSDRTLPAPCGDLGSGKYVVLTIEDSGVGIEPEIVPRIFEPFFTTKDPGKGTGLGLSTVYGIVKQSGGTIRVESVVGRGTRFELFFPACAANPAAAEDKPAPSKANRSETVLLVEDEPAVRRLTASMLARNGHPVLSAGSAEEALELIDRHPGRVDLLITDIVMPGMSGLDLARRVRDRWSSVRVLYISGYAAAALPQSDPIPESALLAKPFSAQALTERVQEVLDAGPGVETSK